MPTRKYHHQTKLKNKNKTIINLKLAYLINEVLNVNREADKGTKAGRKSEKVCLLFFFFFWLSSKAIDFFRDIDRPLFEGTIIWAVDGVYSGPFNRWIFIWGKVSMGMFMLSRWRSGNYFLIEFSSFCYFPIIVIYECYRIVGFLMEMNENL